MATKLFGEQYVAKMDTPGTTKESRENMHDTSHAGSLGDMDAHYQQYRRCVDAFEDIISENTEPYDILGDKRMTGEDIHKYIRQPGGLGHSLVVMNRFVVPSGQCRADNQAGGNIYIQRRQLVAHGDLFIVEGLVVTHCHSPAAG